MDEKGNGAPEKIGFGLKVGVENRDIIAVFDVAALHAFLESPCFVPISVVPDFVLDVYAFACPSLAL